MSRTVISGANGLVGDTISELVQVCLAWNRVTETRKASSFANGTGFVVYRALVTRVGTRSCLRVLIDSEKVKHICI